MSSGSGQDRPEQLKRLRHSPMVDGDFLQAFAILRWLWPNSKLSLNISRIVRVFSRAAGKTGPHFRLMRPLFDEHDSALALAGVTR